MKRTVISILAISLLLAACTPYGQPIRTAKIQDQTYAISTETQTSTQAPIEFNEQCYDPQRGCLAGKTCFSKEPFNYPDTTSTIGVCNKDCSCGPDPTFCTGPCDDGNPNTCPDNYQIIGGECKCAGNPPPPQQCTKGGILGPLDVPLTSCITTVEGKCVNNKPVYPECDCKKIAGKECTNPATSKQGVCSTECGCITADLPRPPTIQECSKWTEEYFPTTTEKPSLMETCIKHAYIDGSYDKKTKEWEFLIGWTFKK